MFLTIQIEAPNTSVENLNQVLLDGDSTKPKEVMVQIRNLLDTINSGIIPATVNAISSTVSGTVSGQTGGVFVSLNLL